MLTVWTRMIMMMMMRTRVERQMFARVARDLAHSHSILCACSQVLAVAEQLLEVVVVVVAAAAAGES